MSIIEKTIESICDTIKSDLGDSDILISAKSTTDDKSILIQIACMPDYLYPALCVLILFFNIYSLFVTGSLFFNLKYQARSAFLKGVRALNFSPFNDLVRLLDSLMLARIHLYELS